MQDLGRRAQTFLAYPRVKKGPLVNLLDSDWGIFDFIGGNLGI